MFERQPDLDVVYVPADTDSEVVVETATAWLRSQPGQPLVRLHAKKMYDNQLLKTGTRGATVENPNSVLGSGWRGGPVLAPYPSEEVLAALSDPLASMVTKVCVIEWQEKPHRRAWLEAHRAVDLISGARAGAGNPPLLDPIVLVAMRQLSDGVNHNNGLLSGYEKSFAVRTLQELRRSGHWPDVGNLCAWALATGSTEVEVKYLRSYARGVAAGKGFRLPEAVGPKRGEADRWAEEVAGSG